MKAKQILSFLLAFALLASALPLTAFAAQLPSDAVASSGTTGDCQWTYSSGRLIVTGNGAMADYSTSTAPPWGRSVKEVILTEGVTYLGKDTFYDCDSLTYISMPSTLQKIGSAAFYFCDKIQEIIVPDGVTDIGGNAFSQCTALEHVKLPKRLDNVGDYMFHFSTNIKQVDMPEEIPYLSAMMFQRCEQMESIVIPDTVKEIRQNAFCACRKLQSVELPEGLTYIAVYALAMCDALTEVRVPDSVKNLNYGSFKDCPNLQKVDLPEGLESIGGYAFANCPQLSELTIPSTVDSIGEGAFLDCVSLNVGIPDDLTTLGGKAFHNTAWFNGLPDGVIYFHDAAYGYAGHTPAHISIREGTVSIMECAFENADNVTEVDLPSSLTTIGTKAFFGCTSLESMHIPIDIPNFTFQDCTSLHTVVIEEGVTSIGLSAFSGCTALKNLIIADSVSSMPCNVDTGVFRNCTSLESVALPSQLQKVESNAFKGCTALKQVMFRSADTEIVYANHGDDMRFEYSFKDCPSFTVYAPSGSKAETYAKEMKHPFCSTDVSGDCAVSYANGTLTVSGSGEMADYTEALLPAWSLFPEAYPGMRRIVVEDDVTGIGDLAFYGCEAAEVSAPASLTRLGKNALDGTAWLAAQPEGNVNVGNVFYTYQGDYPELLTIEGVTVIADSALSGAEGLQQVEIGAEVEVIGKNAFKGCPDLTAVGILTSDCTINSGAFKNCPKLVIYCIDQSTAYTYAKDNNITNMRTSGSYDGCHWRVIGTTLTIDGEGSVPDFVQYAGWNKEKSPWNDGITEVIVGKGVAKVGNYAFSNIGTLKKLIVQSRTSELSTLSLPNSKIDLYCFKDSKVDKDVAGNWLLSRNVTLYYLGEKGDANIDGVVNIQDATFLQAAFAEFDLPLSLDDEDVQAMGDLNEDGKLDVRDVTALQRLLVNE